MNDKPRLTSAPGPVPKGAVVSATLARLVADGVLRQDQANAVQDALAAQAVRGPRVRWAELAGYLGGGLLLAGATMLVARSWEDLAEAAQITLLLALTVGLVAVAVPVAGGLGVLLHREPAAAPAPRTRFAAVLLTLASGTAALAAGVAADGHEFLISTSAGLIMAVAGYVVLPSLLGLLACGLFSAFAVGALTDDLGGSVLAVGIALIALGAVWIALAVHGVLLHRVWGFAVGAAIALIGAQIPLGEYGSAPWAYGLTLAVAVACLALHWRERSWVLLVAGVIGVTLAVPEAIWDWTDGAVGGALIMIVAGVVLVAASVAGLKLHGRKPVQPEGQ